MTLLTLEVRSPDGVLYEGPVSAIRAEDHEGWFGILPGRRDIVASLPPGIVLFEDGRGEGFIAVSRALLSLDGASCRVLAPEARLARDVGEAARALATLRDSRRERSERRRDAMKSLEREALRRMVGALREASP